MLEFNIGDRMCQRKMGKRRLKSTRCMKTQSWTSGLQVTLPISRRTRVTNLKSFINQDHEVSNRVLCLIQVLTPDQHVSIGSPKGRYHKYYREVTLLTAVSASPK
uniref:Uncharacterized protein n=1 Tax=Schistocephalus solidus TaxID=70667 RepID=A0A0V0JDM6_SCHSO